jgi:hypothetical protein
VEAKISMPTKNYKYTTKQVAEKTGLSVERVTQARNTYGLGKWIDKRTVLYCQEDINLILDRKGMSGKARTKHEKKR